MESNAFGIIVKGVGGLYSVRLLNDTLAPMGTVVKCRARGSFRHEHMTPLPGDRVTLVYSEEENKKGKDATDLVIDRIEERRNALIRPPMANLDVLFVTLAAAAPIPILTTVDKLIAIAEFNRIEPVIVVTKSDLNPAYAEELAALYRGAGFTVFVTGADREDATEEMSRWIEEGLKGRIAAFAGASGIGKSTLMNRLFPNLSLSTAEISRKIERGRHTTRQVDLFCLSDSPDCGYVADTPGFSMLDFERFDFFEKDDLPLTFREFVPHIGDCRYTKCSHTKEEGCAILQAVKEGKISSSRHGSYLELHETLKKKKKWN